MKRLEFKQPLYGRPGLLGMETRTDNKLQQDITSWPSRTDRRRRLAPLDRVVHEWGHGSMQIDEALDNVPVDLSTYGLYAVSYLTELSMYDRKETAVDPHKSLLLGAMTQDTIYEYSATVRAAFPKAAPYVIDIVGDRTPYVPSDIAHFTYGDATKLPFIDSSMDTVHSNRLFHMIRGKDSRPQITQRICDESFRVLRPGGIVLFVENTSDIALLENGLEQSGFNNIRTRGADRFHKRIDMIQVFRETPSAAPKRLDHISFLTAQKPK